MALKLPHLSPSPSASRSFVLKEIGSRQEKAGRGRTLWIDSRSLGKSRAILSDDDEPEDQVGIRLEFSDGTGGFRPEDPAREPYQNVRLETGRGGIWITPTFVVGLYAADDLPGFTFIRLAEKSGKWIRVKGEPRQMAEKLHIRLN